MNKNNREGDIKNIAEILGPNLESFIESVLQRDVTLNQTIAQEQLGAMNILDGDLQEIIKISNGQAQSAEELNKLANFSELLEKLQPDDANIGALVDTLNREDNSRSIREILGNSLESFVEAILNRDVNLADTTNIGQGFSGDLDRINGANVTAREEELVELLKSNQEDKQSNTGDTIITNEINITIDGVADETTAEEVADIVAEKINSQIENKDTLVV